MGKTVISRYYIPKGQASTNTPNIKNRIKASNHCTTSLPPSPKFPLPLQALFEPTNPKQSEEDDTSSSGDVVPVSPSPIY